MSDNKVQILVPCQIFKQKADISKSIAKQMPSNASSTPIAAQPDLLFMRSVLVSTGENKNDDVFLPEEMWNARSTPVLKPVDWEHNTGRELTREEQLENPGKVIVDNQTIGVMYNAYTVDENNEIIDEARASASDFEVPSKFDIIDEAVIWKALYPAVAQRIERGAANGTLFVSMEAWFTDYFYLVGSKVVARNAETAFLDRALRSNGGSGSYAGERVRRALRNITFGGKGIVARPANEPSVITHVSHEPIKAGASVYKTIADNIICDIRNTKATEPRKDVEMPNADKEQQVSLELYTKANEENVNLRAESKNRDAELAKANDEVASLKTQASNVVSAFTKGAQLLEELIPGFSSRVTSGNPENFFSVLSEVLEADKDAKAAVEKQLEESLAKIANIELEVRSSAREAKIDTLLGVAKFPDFLKKKDEKDGEKKDEEKDKKEKAKTKAKKDKMLAAVRDLTDEQFDSLYEVWAEQKSEADEALAQMDKKSAKEDMKKDEKKDMKDEKKDDTKAGPGKKFASVEETVREVLASMSSDDSSKVDVDALIAVASGRQESTDEENLMQVLDNVKASEKTPSTGEEVAQGVDLRSSFSGLVGKMLGTDDEETN